MLERILKLIVSFLYSRHFLSIVIALGFLIRLCWIFFFHPTPVSDFGFYFNGAESIVKGYGYLAIQDFTTAYFPAGYSMFLAALFSIFGCSVAVALAANLALSIGTLVLIYSLAREFFRSEAAGRLSLLLLACYPNNVAYTSLVGTEILHLFLLLLGVTLLFPNIFLKEVSDTRRMVAAGFAFAFATLVKVQTLFLPAFILLACLTYGCEKMSLVHRLKNGTVLYLALILGLTPWVIRNYRLFNDIVLSNNAGLNLYIGNGPDANGTYVEIPWLEAMKNPQDEYRINQTAEREAINYMNAHPWRTLELLPKKLNALFDNGDGMYWNGTNMKSKSEFAKFLLNLFEQINPIYEGVLYILFTLSLLFGGWNRLRHGKDHGWPSVGALVVLYFTGIYLLCYGAPRYNFPIIPWMIMYSAALLSSLFANQNVQRN